MPKLRHPFFSLAARGSFARSIVITTAGGQTIARRLRPPAYTLTAAQLMQRSFFNAAIQKWHTLTPAQKQAYHDLDPQIGANPAYLNFMKEFLMANVPVDVLSSVLPAGAATAAAQASLLAELLQKLETTDLQLTASKELVTLPTGLVGAVETKLLAFTGGILKTAPGLGGLLQAYSVGVVASGAGWTTILNLAGLGLVETLAFSSNYNASEAYIAVDGRAFSFPAPSGAVFATIKPANLNAIGGESRLLKAGLYDTINDYYYYFLKRPIQYNATFEFLIRQQSGVNKNITGIVEYRPIA